jgi:hypothetical protein
LANLLLTMKITMLNPVILPNDGRCDRTTAGGGKERPTKAIVSPASPSKNMSNSNESSSSIQLSPGESFSSSSLRCSDLQRGGDAGAGRRSTGLSFWNVDDESGSTRLMTDDSFLMNLPSSSRTSPIWDVAEGANSEEAEADEGDPETDATGLQHSNGVTTTPPVALPGMQETIIVADDEQERTIVCTGDSNNDVVKGDAAEVETSTSTTAGPTQKMDDTGNTQPRRVHFGTLEIYEHVIHLGGAIPGSGPPLTLEWQAQTHFSVPLEDYEALRPGQPRKGHELLRSKKQRTDM